MFVVEVRKWAQGSVLGGRWKFSEWLGQRQASQGKNKISLLDPIAKSFEIGYVMNFSYFAVIKISYFFSKIYIYQRNSDVKVSIDPSNQGLY